MALRLLSPVLVETPAAGPVRISEGPLLNAAQHGDDDALEALLRHYSQLVYRFGMRMCRDPQDAQDVMQETLFAAARTLPGFRGASSVSTWLYTIARSFCIKKRRRRLSTPRLVSLESGIRYAGETPDPAPDPERRLAARELATALESAIASLPPSARQALFLMEVEGLPAAQAARVAGVGVPALKSRLRRARVALRARLAPLVGPPGGG